MNANRSNWVFSFVLVVVLVFLLKGVAVNYFGFASWLLHTKRTQDGDAARRQAKLSASNLESMLREARQVPPDSQLRCASAAQDWDYVCSYMPTPTQSTARLRFGVTVDAKRWVDVSRIVPVEADVPAPHRK